MASYTLLTGSTGLLGRYLLRDLLVAGQRVAIVARSTQKETVLQRIESFLQLWETEFGAPLPRPVCFEGDICQENLGLEEYACQWIAEHCDSVIHSAAALKFYEENDGEPWRTNVEGTRNVLLLGRNAGIKQLHYVSTAYVCGTRQERILETELDKGQSFRNDYERSKLQAEIMVRSADFLDKVTVYRPAVIAGDSQTGYTNTYHGLFMYLQLMCLFARNTEPGSDGIRHTPVQIKVSGDEPRNVIPVDWTSAVITHLVLKPESHGRTFHLAPRFRMTARQMIEAGYSYFNSTGVEFVGASEGQLQNNIEKNAYENSTMYRDYEVSDPLFDTSNLERFAGHLPCPKIDESMLHRFMAYGEKDRWGKRRRKPIQIPFDTEEHLQSLLSFYGDVDRSQEVLIGIDLQGVGGGQWTIGILNNQLTSIELGITGKSFAVWKTSTQSFSRLAEGEESPDVDDIVDIVLLDLRGQNERKIARLVVNTLFSPCVGSLPPANGVNSRRTKSGITQAHA